MTMDDERIAKDVNREMKKDIILGLLLSIAEKFEEQFDNDQKCLFEKIIKGIDEIYYLDKGK